MRYAFLSTQKTRLDVETEPPRSTYPRPHSEPLTEQDSQSLMLWFLASSRPQTENLVTAKGCSTHTFYKQIQGARHPLKPNPDPVEIQTPKLLSFHTTTLPPTGEEGKGIAQYLKHIHFLSLQNLFINLPCYFINSLWILFYWARLWSETTWGGQKLKWLKMLLIGLLCCFPVSLQQSTSEYSSKRTENRISKSHLHLHVHNSQGNSPNVHQ